MYDEYDEEDQYRCSCADCTWEEEEIEYDEFESDLWDDWK